MDGGNKAIKTDGHKLEDFKVVGQIVINSLVNCGAAQSF